MEKGAWKEGTNHRQGSGENIPVVEIDESGREGEEGDLVWYGREGDNTGRETLVTGKVIREGSR